MISSKTKLRPGPECVPGLLLYGGKLMNKRELIEEVLDALRNMEDAVETITTLDVDAVMDAIEKESEE